jgi:hypothetical protein
MAKLTPVVLWEFVAKPGNRGGARYLFHLELCRRAQMQSKFEIGSSTRLEYINQGMRSFIEDLLPKYLLG